MEAGMITTVLLVACATICIGVGIFYFFINNTKNKGRICILLLGIGGGIWALGSALYGNCTDDRLAQNFMAACFITGCILCFAFCAASILYYIGRRKLCVKVRENMWHTSFWEIQLCFFRQFRIRCCHFMELNLIPVRFMV